MLPGMANKGAAKKEVENKWTRSQTKFKMALFVVPPQKELLLCNNSLIAFVAFYPLTNFYEVILIIMIAKKN